MLTNLLWLRHARLGRGLSPGGAKPLQAALAALAPEWQVLGNRRARGIDGPPWVKYIALHPRKGIALIDLLPADPQDAIEPLYAFLEQNEQHGLPPGDPPIVAVALTGDEGDRIAQCLSAAFVGVAASGITDATWTEAVIALLLSTEGLELARLTRAPQKSATPIVALTDTEEPASPPINKERPSRRPAEAAERDHPIDAPPPRVAEPPPRPAMPARKESTIATWAAQQKPMANETPAPQAPAPVAPPPEIVVEREAQAAPPVPPAALLAPARDVAIWSIASAVAASLVLGAIALVYADWPRPASTVITETNPPSPPAAVSTALPALSPPIETASAETAQARPQPLATGAASSPPEVSSPPALAPAPAPAEAEPHYVFASRPIWEEARLKKKKRSATAQRGRSRPQQEAANPFAAFNNWLTEHRF